MNFLAHQHLSQQYKGIRAGNFLADFIRGNDLEKYPEEVQLGIKLHRKIDEYTDTHPIVSRSKHRLYKYQGKYTSVIMDIYYDYFLAKKWVNYSDEKLNEFSQTVYADFEEMKLVFTEKIISILPAMKKNDWFYNYQFYWGIEKSLLSIARRAHFSNKIVDSLKHLKILEQELEKDFEEFYPQLMAMTIDFIATHKSFLDKK